MGDKMSTKAKDLLKQIEQFLDSLSDKDKEDIKEMQFTATKRVADPDEASICFSLVASVPFKKGKAKKIV